MVHEIVTIKLYYHHNCKEKDMARSGSKTETLFDDVPEPPKVLRLTLRSKSTTWQRFKASMATLDLSPAELMKSLNDDRAKLVKKLEDGEDLTDEEIEFLNEAMKKRLRATLKKFEKQAIEITTIERTYTREEMKLKIEVQTGLLDWLSNLFQWVFEIKDQSNLCKS